MATWGDVQRDLPDFAASVRRCFEARKHATLATLRRDGSPRISGTEVEVTDEGVYIGSLSGAVKALDLRRDGRYALHSPTVDPPTDNPEDWPGEAKLAGVAVEVDRPSGPSGAHRFHLTLGEVVLTRVVGNRLVIQSWHEGRGFQERSRS